MSTCASFQVQMASIMEVLTKTAVAEITKLVDDGSSAIRLEMCRSQRENEALKRKLWQMERELGTVRVCGEGAPDNSLNIAFEVQFCDEFTEVQRPKVASKGSVSSVFDERLSTGPAKDDQNVPVEKNRVSSDALDIKYEPVDGEQVWPESLLLNEDRLEEDPGRSQSQVEQKYSGENTCDTLGAAGADGGAGPLCGEEELHMQPCPAGDPEKGLQAELKQEPEPEGEPLTPVFPRQPVTTALPQLKAQCAWSEADGSSGMVQKKQGQPGGSSEHGGARFDDDFVPPQCRASRRLRSETVKGLTLHLGQQQNVAPLTEEHCRWLADDISAEMAFPLGSQGEHGGSTPCEASFHTLTEAQEQQSLGKQFSCLECGKDFTSSSVLEQHQRIHSRKKPFGKSFSHWHVFQEHKNIHTGLKPYVCEECGKRFRYKGYLKIHRRVHTREKPFSGLQCGKGFMHMNTLKTHQITHTRDKCISCTMCNKTFASLTVLVQHHQSAHTGEKGVICKFCGKLFDSTDSLKEHCLAHHRGKRFSCTLCGKGFTRKGGLKIHQSVHTGEKPHHCNECGKSFAHPCNLKTHQRVHTGEKPFSCTLCGKGFAHKCALQKHILSHSQE